MPTLAKRKLIKFGESGLVLTVPKGWARYHDLKPGDKVEIEANGELTVRILEESKEQGNGKTDK
ncbi:hypothetical protein ES703_102867 [subsurface metagenome]